VATAGLALVYALTPGSAQGVSKAPLPGLVGGNARWLVPALLTAAPVLAWSMARLGRARVLGEMAALVAAWGGIADSFDVPRHTAALCAVAVALVVGAAYLVRRVLSGRPGAQRLRAAVALGLVLTVAVAAVGQAAQRRYNRKRFAGASVVLSWVNAHAASGRQVGIAGGWTPGFVPVYGLYGPRFGNDVSYVGPVHDGLLSQYKRAAPFRRALNRQGIEVLVVGRQPEPNFKTLQLPPPYRHPPEVRWAVESGRYVELLSDDRFVLVVDRELAREARQ
jgi:hypothetical protein